MATRSFLRTVDALEPTLIHLHNLHGYYIHFELLFQWLKSSGLPVVWTLHDCWPYTGHCAYYSLAACSKWVEHCERCPQLATYPASWGVDASAAMFERKRRAFQGVKGLTLVTPSVWLAGEVRRSFLGSYPTKVIANGIDLLVFKPTRSDQLRRKIGLSPDVPVVLGVASDFSEPRKGLRLLVELARSLGDRARVVLIGVPRRLATSLPATVTAMPRTESITELAAAYSMASVFVNPTLEDNFPTVSLEALACGTPVVTFLTGGCGEQVSPTTGFVVKQSSSGDLLAAVTKVLDLGKPHYYTSCLTSASLYSTRTMCADYLSLYADIFTARSNASGERNSDQ